MASLLSLAALFLILLSQASSDVDQAESAGQLLNNHLLNADADQPSPQQPTVRVFTKAQLEYSLTVRAGQAVLAPANAEDENQHWIRDMRLGNLVKDEEGNPGFALINKATGQALRHPSGTGEPVPLVPYNPNFLDTTILWSESGDLGDAFDCIRVVNNIVYNFDAFHGDGDHGGVRDGTYLVIYVWLKGDNQRWQIMPYNTAV